LTAFCACGIAQCGACIVHVAGKPVRSCMLPISAVRDRAVTTIEGVGATPVGAKVRKAWLDLEVIHGTSRWKGSSGRRPLRL
jgi:isoquinoline 1-oxidoreductase alpha subunit